MTNTNKLSLFLALVLLPVLALGCDTLGSEDEDATAGTVYVANQGNFSEGNGSVTLYDPLADETTPDLYGANLSGTTVQSLTLHDDRVYVIANSGSYVNVFDAESNAQVAQVQMPSPRYMAVAGSEKAYVTNQLYSRPSMVTVVNTSTQTVTDSIEVGGLAEGIAVAGDRAYVALGAFGSGSTLAVIDTNTDAVVDTVDAECDGARTVFADADDEIYVVCTGQTQYDDEGNVSGRTDGAVRVLDGATGEIVERIAVDGPLGAEGPGQDAYYAADLQEAYVVKGDDALLRFDTAANARTDELTIDGAAIGAVAYDADQQRLYVGHVPGFSERGTVTIHRRDGSQVGSFTAGIAPTYIALRHEER